MVSKELGGAGRSYPLKWTACFLLATTLTVCAQTADNGAVTGKKATSAKTTNKELPVTADQLHQPVLWKQQADIASLDMYQGPGGVKHEPQPPFYICARGKEWGPIPSSTLPMQVETSGASSLGMSRGRRSWLLACFGPWGITPTYDYLLPTATVTGIKMSRGADLVKGGTVQDARFSRQPGGEKKIGIWKWKTNPFYGKREFNGLRVMMAVMNNWDLKDP